MFQPSAHYQLFKSALPVLIGLTAALGGVSNATAGGSLQFPTVSREDGSYDRVFSRYLEVCAVTQMKNRSGGGGGDFGHAVAFIKGACLDDQSYAPATKVKKCQVANEADLANPEMGVGISTAGEFANVRWIGSQGRQVFFHGLTLKSGEPYNMETALRDKNAMNEAFTTWGVILHEPQGISSDLKKSRDLYQKLVLDHRAPGTLSVEEKAGIRAYQEVVTNNSIGTDLALSTARNIYCVRTPISESQLDYMIGFLNYENDKYRDFKQTYQWDATKDNCAHMVHDMIWRGGMARELKRNLVPPFNFLQIAIPAQEVIDLGDRLLNAELADPVSLFATSPKEGWEAHGWFPSPVGVMSEFIPARGRRADGSDGVYPQDPQGNEFFITNAFVALGGIPKITDQKFAELMLRSESTDLRSNLQYSLDRYNRAIQVMDSNPYQKFLKRLLDKNSGLFEILKDNFGLGSVFDLGLKLPNLFKNYYDRYRADLNQSRQEIQRKLEQL